MKNTNISRMVQLAILLAVVIVLQCFFGSIVIGTTSFSVVLVTIVIGAIVLVVLIYGISGQDFFTNLLFQSHPVFTAVICLGKGAAAGWGAGMVYKLLAKLSSFWGSVAAAAAAPILNTGLFILGSLTLVQDTLQANLATFGADNLVVFLVIGCAGVNFLVEFCVNLILSPAIFRVVTVVKKKIAK